jgi:hypothetical protein
LAYSGSRIAWSNPETFECSIDPCIDCFPGSDPGLTKIYEIGPFRLDCDAGVLTEAGPPVALGSRAVSVLTALIERANEYVQKTSIMDAAGPARAMIVRLSGSRDGASRKIGLVVSGAAT